MTAEDLAARVRRLEDLQAIGQLRAHYCQALVSALLTPETYRSSLSDS